MSALLGAYLWWVSPEDETVEDALESKNLPDDFRDILDVSVATSVANSVLSESQAAVILSNADLIETFSLSNDFMQVYVWNHLLAETETGLPDEWVEKWRLFTSSYLDQKKGVITEAVDTVAEFASGIFWDTVELAEDIGETTKKIISSPFGMIVGAAVVAGGAYKLTR